MIREIHTFISICDNGTFAAAAKQLGLTQSAISAQMKTLENQLGIALFDRSRRGAILSKQGEHALPLARQIADLYAKMGQNPDENARSGSLKLGISSALQSVFLAKLLSTLPETPQMQIANPIDLMEHIRAKSLDVAIIVRPDSPLSPELATQSLGQDECVLIAKNDVHSQDYQNILSKMPILAYDNSAFGNGKLAQFFRQHNAPTPTLTSDDPNTLISLVKQGFGVTILPQSCLKNADLSGLTQIAVPVSREWIAVSGDEKIARAIAYAWQNTPAAPTWETKHSGSSTNFGLKNKILSTNYRN